jgi:hypothetical protein
MIKPQGSDSLSQFKFDALSQALGAADAALKVGYHRTPRVTINTGPGTVMTVLSEDEAKFVAEDQAEVVKSGGLLTPQRSQVAETDFILHVQFGLATLPPLSFPTEDEREEAITLALERGHLQYVIKEEHDYMFVKLASGVMLLSFTGKEYLDQLRQAQLMRQKQLQAQAAQQQGGPRIFIPGGR